MNFVDDWNSAKNYASKNFGDIIFTNGCFDILHSGHVKLLNHLKKEASRRYPKYYYFFLLVGLNSDESIERIRGKKPVMNYEERSFIIDNLKCVDGVVRFSQDTPELLITFIKPTVLGKGGDYKDKEIAGEKCVLEYGGTVLKNFFVEGFSSGRIKDKIKTTTNYTNDI